MITTQSSLTLSLATAFGVYMIAGGLSGLIGRDRWSATLENFRGKAGLTFISGVFVYVLGATIIIVHNHWTDLLAGFISLFGWVAAIEGLIIIAMPEPLLNWAISMTKPGLVRIFAIGVIIFGVLLVVLGLTGETS